MLSMGITDWITVDVGSQFEAGGSTWEIAAIKGDYLHLIEVQTETDEEE